MLSFPTSDGVRRIEHSESQRPAARIRPRSHAPHGLPRAHFRAPANQPNAAAAILEERARIARELHDSVSQTLYAITLTASRARSVLEQNENATLQHMIDDVLQLANAGQSELRTLLTNIRSDRLTSSGLSSALTSLAAEVRTRNGLDIRLTPADEPDLAAATQDALVMIAREALHNVVKHAHADHVDIVVAVDAEQSLLLIVDDGRGFDLGAPRPGHFGLRSMRERAAEIGGTLGLVSSDGTGTQVRVCIPRTGRA